MTFTISIGAWGGFYWQRGFATRLCVGFIAITIWPFDVDFYIEQQIAEIKALRAALNATAPGLWLLKNGATTLATIRRTATGYAWETGAARGDCRFYDEAQRAVRKALKGQSA